jgi:hypothetical protein
MRGYIRESVSLRGFPSGKRWRSLVLKINGKRYYSDNASRKFAFIIGHLNGRGDMEER